MFACGPLQTSHCFFLYILKSITGDTASTTTVPDDVQCITTHKLHRMLKLPSVFDKKVYVSEVILLVKKKLKQSLWYMQQEF